MSAFLRSAIDLFLPRRCLVCDEGLGDIRAGRICDGCLESIEGQSFEGLDWCERCALPGPLPNGAGLHSCQALPAIDGARSFGQYEGALRGAILALKFGTRTALAEPLGEMVAHAAEALGPADIVVAVPAHRLRLRERGFDQAAMLARRVADTLGIPDHSPALVRRISTGQQTGRSRRKRRENLRSAMVADPGAVSGLRVLLIDDVLTTGATATACAVALKDAGARSIRVATVARALPAPGSLRSQRLAGAIIDVP